MNFDILRLRLRNLKEEQGITFKFVSDQCSISTNKVHKFVAGHIKKLSESEADRLDSYLSSQGY